MSFNFQKYSGALNFLMASLLGIAIIYTQLTIFPMLSLIGLFPYILLWVSQGWRWTLVSYLVTSVAVWLLFGLPAVLGTMPVIVIIASLLAVFIERKLDDYRSIFLASMACLFVLLATIYLEEQISGISMNDALQPLVRDAMENVVAEMQMMAGEEVGSSLEIQLAGIMVMTWMSQHVPAIMYITALFLVTINYYFASAVLARTDALIERKYFSELTMPKMLAGSLAISILLLLYFGSGQVQLEIIGSNLMTMSLALVLLNGLSTTAMFFRRRLLNFFVVYLGVIFFGIKEVAIALLIMGAVDLIADLRGRITLGGGPDGR